MSHTNVENVIKGLGGDPVWFLLLLVHTLNVFINKFAAGARIFFDFSMSHCHKQYRSEEISPHTVVSLSINNFELNLMFILDE